MTRREMIDTQTSCFIIVENAIILLSTTVLKSFEVGEANLKYYTLSKDMHSIATDLISICKSPEILICHNFCTGTCIYLMINFHNLSKYILFLKFRLHKIQL